MPLKPVKLGLVSFQLLKSPAFHLLFIVRGEQKKSRGPWNDCPFLQTASAITQADYRIRKTRRGLGYLCNHLLSSPRRE